MIERYGEEIEFDLFERGADLLDYFRGARPWAQLDRYVRRLPSWSETKRAMADDDELQRYREEHAPKTSARRPPRLTEWTLADELFAALADTTNAICVAVGQSVSPRGKGPKFKPGRRPLTAAERAERRRDRDTIAEIVSIMLPREPGSG